uniref:Replication factor A C-terminal domain-containing protein n=1 Tax=Chenopodium quinoa TaxID=63459 RepID=A0A803MWE0_CHEQI
MSSCGQTHDQSFVVTVTADGDDDAAITALLQGDDPREMVFLPRANLRPSSSSHYPFKFERIQFPIKLSFAMTINKAQGQTHNKMNPEYTPISNLTPQTKAYKVRAKVIEKAEPKLSPNKTLYQWLKLEDNEGNRIRGTLFENEVESFKGILELGREYEIANAPLRAINEKWKTREDDFQMTFGGNTTIQPLQAEAGLVLPKYTPIASIPRTSSKNERFGIYLTASAQAGQTASGASMDVREVVIADDRLLASILYVYISHTWAFRRDSRKSQEMLTDTMQEERIWLKAKIPEPDVGKIIAYIGCDNCGRCCEELAGETFKCSSCPNKVCTATARVNYTFTITDGTGELKLTAFGAECEKLFGMKLADIYSKLIVVNNSHT